MSDSAGVYCFPSFSTYYRPVARYRILGSSKLPSGGEYDVPSGREYRLTKDVVREMDRRDIRVF